MTWKQIKEAVEESGLEEDQEISLIQCANGDGEGTYHRVYLMSFDDGGDDRQGSDDEWPSLIGGRSRAGACGMPSVAIHRDRNPLITRRNRRLS